MVVLFQSAFCQNNGQDALLYNTKIVPSSGATIRSYQDRAH